MACMSRWANQSLERWAPQVICSSASLPLHGDSQGHVFIAKCLMEDLGQGNTQLPTWSLIWNLNPFSGSRHHAWKCKLPVQGTHSWVNGHSGEFHPPSWRQCEACIYYQVIGPVTPLFATTAIPCKGAVFANQQVLKLLPMEVEWF